MTGSAQRMRQWQGPAVLGHGFRPFFLMAGLWATLAMAIWVAALSGATPFPLAFAASDWHGHAFVFGYVSSVFAGFLLTAVPNWTGRLPVVGWPLAGLAALWIAGRIATVFGGAWPWKLVLLADLSLPVALIGFLGREIVAGRNWRNLPVLGILCLFAVANGVFHLAAAQSADPRFGLRLGLAATLLMIALIGGRIVPSFTRNWLAARSAKRLPVPFGRADGLVMAMTVLALGGFVLAPEAQVTGVLSLLAGAANLWRLSRWQGLATGAEPLVWVLHLAYLGLALGFVMIGLAGFGLVPQSGALHVWLVGAVGMMTLAVMTRASLGHAGLPLQASKAVTSLYLALVLAIPVRLAAGLRPDLGWLLDIAALLWIAAFGGFFLIYAPILLRKRQATKTARKP